MYQYTDKLSQFTRSSIESGTAIHGGEYFGSSGVVTCRYYSIYIIDHNQSASIRVKGMGRYSLTACDSSSIAT